MSNSRFDIIIEIRLHGGDHVRSKLLLQAFDSLETALYASDRKDIELAASQLEISKVVRDASLERLRQYKNNRLLLMEARTGSIEIAALVAGVSFFILNQTLGETIKESYTHSKIHSTLRDFFSKQIDDKALFIAESIRRAFVSKKQDVTVKLQPPTGDKPNRVVVDFADWVKRDRQERIGSLSEELDKNK